MKISWLFSLFDEDPKGHLLRYPDIFNKEEEEVIVVCERDLPGKTRGARFDHALRRARGEIVVLVHPRSILPKTAREELLYHRSSRWGAFTHRFDQSHPILNFTSWWSNRVRGDIQDIFYLDHILWGERELLLRAGGIPHAPVFEDTLLCEKLRGFCRPQRLPGVAITSSIRFQKNGILRQSLLNQKLKWEYLRGGDLEAMDREYEKGLHLNQRTKS